VTNTFVVLLPISGTIRLEVKADSVDDAVNIAVEFNDHPERAASLPVITKGAAYSVERDSISAREKGDGE
jgi:hypothetical protein